MCPVITIKLSVSPSSACRIACTRWVTVLLGQRKELNLSHLNDSPTLILPFLGEYAIPTVPIAESSNIQRLRPSTVPSVPIIPILWQLLIPRALADYAEAIEQNKTGNSMPSAGGSVKILVYKVRSVFKGQLLSRFRHHGFHSSVGGYRALSPMNHDSSVAMVSLSRTLGCTLESDVDAASTQMGTVIELTMAAGPLFRKSGQLKTWMILPSKPIHVKRGGSAGIYADGDTRHLWNPVYNVIYDLGGGDVFHYGYDHPDLYEGGYLEWWMGSLRLATFPTSGVR
ncbi:uncharacterized protein BO96DRAFT_345303 [Aspergillus niger CBS 101883]|uniref:Uncharacterized protein n=2 Tax=Aspergillus niger TaxID=5061 RepID=A2QP56_ASPNC|nr:uncharacterized protein BO96DRAFT_345303 [Aspergillus niger CBS 101883]XP_059605401.1 hypothetical protein An07g08270 [Aspergillus niger]PYH53394.1 hypothetical protein BO96DRAFT_345303 [Aspergillus niger CBS 101883]CAK48209.1 hypothetical protein An07g08270 [Aspergillus niger]